MPLTDWEILRRAYERETDSRNQKPWHNSWTYYDIGAARSDVVRLMDEGMVCVSAKYDGGPTKYRLTDKGSSFVFAQQMEHEFSKVPADNIMDAMSLVIGFDDLKAEIAYSIEAGKRVHFLLEGPPACAKSLILEALRSSVPGAYPAFGSRTSAAGLSDILFEHQPSMLLLDEVDKMEHRCFSILLGLMEAGEILETKSQKTRGIKLKTSVIGACNSSLKFSPEFLSRFDFHPYFPPYTRDEFIDVCRGFLSRATDCPLELAETIGRLVHDNELGDVRRARAVYKLMHEPTEDEMHRVIQMMLKYSPQEKQDSRQNNSSRPRRLPGL